MKNVRVFVCALYVFWYILCTGFSDSLAARTRNRRRAVTTRARVVRADRSTLRTNNNKNKKIKKKKNVCRLQLKRWPWHALRFAHCKVYVYIHKRSISADVNTFVRIREKTCPRVYRYRRYGTAEVHYSRDNVLTRQYTRRTERWFKYWINAFTHISTESTPNTLTPRLYYGVF